MKYLRLMGAATVIFFFQSCTKTEADVVPELQFTFAPAVDEIEISKSRLVTDFPLDSSHYISVPVDVHRSGPWSFATDTLNGMRFTGSGTFSDTGRHTIKLMAEGTPKLSGEISVPVQVGATTRTFTVKIVDAYFDVNLGDENVAVECYAGSRYSYDAYPMPDTANGQEIVYQHYSLFDKSDYLGGYYFTIRKHEFLVNDKPDIAEQAALYAPGVYDLWRWGAARQGYNIGFAKFDDPMYLSFITDNYGANDKVEILQSVQVNEPSPTFPMEGAPYFKMKIRFHCNVTTFYLDKSTLEGEAIVIFRAVK